MFEVTIPGIYTLDTVVNGTAFTRLTLPDGFAVNPAGSPELPVLTYKVAIPECAGVEIESRIYSTQAMPSCWVYPVPEIVLDQNGTLVEQFAFNARTYAQPYVAEPVAVTISEGALRAQRYVEVTVQPIEFCPVTRQLSVINRVEVTLIFDKSTSDIRQNVGIFNKVATKAFINYEDNGMSAMVNDKAFEREEFTPGNVQWINLTDTAQACQIEADYLIITVPEFFTPNNPNSQLARLANHRSYYNGYDVAILNVEDIFSDAVGFYWEEQDKPIPQYQYKKEQRMRTFIRRVFEGKNALHTGDSCLAFVLLVGDNSGENNEEGMPVGREHGITTNLLPFDAFPSDYYFTCITKDASGYDHTGDLWIGRFSVEDTIQLFNMVHKTINYETKYTPGLWRKNVGSSTIWNLADYGNDYHNFMSNLLDSCGWNYFKVNGWVINGEIKLPTLNYFNTGVVFAQYLTAGDELSSAWRDDLNISYFFNELRNDYMTPFINACASNTVSFVNNECLGEFLTRYDAIKGAVGYIGSTRRMGIQTKLPNGAPSPYQQYQNNLPELLFKCKYGIAGELLLISKNLEDSPFERLRHIYGYNLLGDPALNILADPDSACLQEIASTITITNGETFTVSSDCPLHFLQNGKLIIEDGGTLIIEDGAQIYGEFCQTDTVIHVKGFGFIVGDSVTFNDLNLILLENNIYAKQPLSLDNDFQSINLRNVTFNNTPLTYCGSPLMVANCIFNSGSNLQASIGEFCIDSCTFNQSTIFAFYPYDHYSIYSVSSASIANSNFNGNNSNVAIHLNTLLPLNIQNNIVSNYETGIFISNCGATLANKVDSYIINNDVSSCNTGIELYKTVASFNSNYIHNNTFGIKLFNNSYTHFDNSAHLPQYFQNNDSYELYASENSFPVIFCCNHIIDDDNGSNPNYPLIYWDVNTPYSGPQQNVNYNDWSNNFDPIEGLFPPNAFICNIIGCPGKSGTPPAETLYHTGLTYFAEEDFSNAELTFKELIQTYPESQFAIGALHELFALEQFINNDYFSLQNYYATFTPADSNLFSVAEFLATRCYVQERFWQPAIDWYENRIENPPSYQDSIFAVIDLGDIHLMMEADTAVHGAKGASACYYRLAEIKPKSKQAYETNKADLLATLPQIKKPKTENLYNPLSDKKGALGQNIPNPATGTTTIAYGINTAGTVEIAIYNAMGQLVKTFPQGALKEGNYHAKISLVNMPNGIYSYVLLVNGERADARRMVVNR